jgi:hypothetical protein
MHRDAQHRFRRIVSHGIPGILLASFTFRSRRRFSNVVFKGIPRLTCAKYGMFLLRRDARRRFFSVLSSGTRNLTYGKCSVLWRRRDDRLRDVWRSLSNVVWNSAPRFFCPKYGAVAKDIATLALVSQRRVLWLPSLMFATSGTLPGVATLGVVLPAPCLMASRGLSWPDFEIWVMARSASCRIVSLDLSTLNILSNVGVGTIHVATLLVGLPASCHIASRVFLAWYGVLSRRCDEGRHDARRRFSSVVSCGMLGLMFTKMESCVGVASWRSSSVCQSRVLWLPRLMFASDGILSRRRFANDVFCGFPGIMNLESASRRRALGRSTSICQRLVLCLHWAHVWYMWNIFLASRRSVSVCKYRAVWHLNTPFGLNCNWRRRQFYNVS